MDGIVPQRDKDDSLYSNPEIYHRFLTTAGDIEKAAAARRRHVVTYDDVYATGASNTKQLPVALSGSREHTTAFSALRIPTGPVPAGRSVRVVLDFEKGPFDIQDVVVYLNAKKCVLAGAAAPVNPQYPDMDYYVFDAENDGAVPPVSVLEVGISDGQATIHWAEVDVL